MTSVTDWAARVTSYTYDSAGRLLTTTRPNGTKQTRAYDKAGQLASLKESTSANGTISSYILTYDASGQVLSEVRTPTVASVVPNLFAMTYNADDQLTQFNGASVTHDADGNMINGPIGSGFGALNYDARNRLSSAGGLTYRYDAESRRVESQVGSTITKYINNPNARLWQVLAIKAGSAPTTYCVYGIGLTYTDTNGAPLYHHYDMRGSTVATSLANGNVTFTAAYGPYGERKDISGTPATPFLFVGQYGVMTDPNSLCFSRARFYNSTTHRFINADPIGFAGGVNWYAYVGNNPVKWTDPDGLKILISGPADFKKSVQDALDQLISKPGGKNLYDKLDQSLNIHEICPSTDGGNAAAANDWTMADNGTGSGSTIFFVPTKNTGGKDATGSYVRPPFVGLGHEMGHSLYIDQGIQNLNMGSGDSGTTPPAEKGSMNAENAIRKEHDLQLRPSYY
jgi:RHS repeat-associated protein